MSDFLPGAIGDPRRRVGERKIRPHKDDLIYVEGWGDANILQSLSSNNRLKFIKHQTNDQLYIGKKGVIRIAKSMPSKSKAIVDMDYDFAGNQIKETPNVRDTRVKCCLQAYLIKDDEWPRLIPYLGRSLYRNETGKRNEFMTLVANDWDMIYLIAKSRTHARLFRGWFFRKNPRKAPRKGTLPTFETFKTKGPQSIDDLVPTEFINDYKRFKRMNSGPLDKIGFNDHSLEEVLLPYVRQIDSTRDEQEIHRNLTKAVEKYLVDSKSFIDIQELIPTYNDL
jgi:hypothetical protein